MLAERSSPASIMPVTNVLERLNEEIKRCTHVVRIFPNAASCLRLIQALAVQMHENWFEAHRYLNMNDRASSRTPCASGRDQPTMPCAQRAAHQATAMTHFTEDSGHTDLRRARREVDPGLAEAALPAPHPRPANPPRRATSATLSRSAEPQDDPSPRHVVAIPTIASK
jgi:hypothetical protein